MNNSTILLPDCVRRIVKDLPFRADSAGKSDAAVYLYEDYVLKIGRPSPESENERAFCEWAKGKLPVPEVLAFCTRGDTCFELMTRVKGEMLCAPAYLAEPRKVIRLAADALKRLWSVDITGCPAAVSPLSARLKRARETVKAGASVENTEPETYGPDGFSGPEELLSRLESNRPPEDVVLTHGDFCLPNLLAADGVFSGYIDLGKAGPADRWQDIALLIRTLHYNFNGVYGGPAVFPSFRPEMLLEELGIAMDEQKYRYYLLLDELY